MIYELKLCSDGYLLVWGPDLFLRGGGGGEERKKKFHWLWPHSARAHGNAARVSRPNPSSLDFAPELLGLAPRLGIYNVMGIYTR